MEPDGVVSERPHKLQPNLSAKGLSKAERRQQRLAAALRLNLKRRKAQQGGRRTSNMSVDVTKNLQDGEPDDCD